MGTISVRSVYLLYLQAAHTGQEEEEERGGEGKGGGGGGGVGPVVSRMADQEQELAEEEKTLFDWCKEGREDRLQALLSPDNINTIDSQVMELRNTHDVIVTLIDCTQGMSLIHWACDRGHLPIVELLVSRGADVNVQVDKHTITLSAGCILSNDVSFTGHRAADTSTLWLDKLANSLPLSHSATFIFISASSCDQGDVVSYLLSNGADPTIKDCDKLTPVQVAEETSTKQLFQNCTM